jgi:hypothetical protein
LYLSLMTFIYDGGSSAEGSDRWQVFSIVYFPNTQ